MHRREWCIWDGKAEVLKRGVQCLTKVLTAKATILRLLNQQIILLISKHRWAIIKPMERTSTRLATMP
jgi:hypothetical protein